MTFKGSEKNLTKPIRYGWRKDIFKMLVEQVKMFFLSTLKSTLIQLRYLVTPDLSVNCYNSEV